MLRPQRRHGVQNSEAFSFQIATDAGGNRSLLERHRQQWRQESMCGWCKDRWGLSWQITPRALSDALAAGGAEAKGAFDAMMTMKIDIAAIEAARRG
ncbi:MAG: VOC family protein [Gemmatimonadaceae bacterium]